MLTHIVVHNGVGVNMLKVGSKRRRTKAQIDADRILAAQKKIDIEEKLAAFEQMQQERDELRAKLVNDQAATNVLNGLISKGHVARASDGNWVVPSVENSEALIPDVRDN